MPLDLRQLPGCSPLVQDYVLSFERVAPFYRWDPRSPTVYPDQAGECDARSYPRTDVKAILRAQNEAWNAPPPVWERIEELGQPQAVTVLTGQQTGLFGGPLFTLYKALTAVQWANRLRRELGRPVIPVFWMTSEDHDLAEADHIKLLDRAGKLVTVRHTGWDPASGSMPANLRLGPAILETLTSVWDLVPATEFTPALRETLEQAFAPQRTLAEAFACWMVHLLGQDGLVLVDGADARLKRLGADILRQELDRAPDTSRQILAVSESLRALGYSAQIEARPDGVNCFLLRDGRRGLTRDAEGFRLRDSGEVIPPADLRRLAEERPELLSPNVALRPILQDFLFPNLAYVAGPGELAYFAQLRPAYEAFGVPMPVVVPRASLTLVESRMAQLLERFDLGLPQLTLEPEQLATRILRAHLPPDFEASLAKAREGVDEIFRGLGEAVGAVDPTLRATVGQAAGHVHGHLTQLERKAVQALKRREAGTRQQVQRLRETLMPAGKPQERVFPVLPYLARYGPSLMERLRSAIDGPGWDHRLLTLRTDREIRQGQGAGRR